MNDNTEIFFFLKNLFCGCGYVRIDFSYMYLQVLDMNEIVVCRKWNEYTCSTFHGAHGASTKREVIIMAVHKNQRAVENSWDFSQ